MMTHMRIIPAQFTLNTEYSGDNFQLDVSRFVDWYWVNFRIVKQ